MVVVGEHNKATMNESMVEVRRVSRIRSHMDFDNGIKYNNDIALLKLDRRLSFREAVAPICLPYPGQSLQYTVFPITTPPIIVLYCWKYINDFM